MKVSAKVEKIIKCSIYNIIFFPSGVGVGVDDVWWGFH